MVIPQWIIYYLRMHNIDDRKYNFTLYFTEHAFFRQNNSTTQRSKRKHRTQQTHAIRTADGMATTTSLKKKQTIKRDTEKYPAAIIYAGINEFCVENYR